MNEQEISELLGSVLGVEVAINRGDPLTAESGGAVILASFVDESGTLGAVLALELGAAAALAAALTGAEASVRSDAVAAGGLEGELLEDWTEVSKVCAQLVRLPGASSLAFSEVTQTSTGLSGDAAALLGEPAMRAGWTASVPGYGGGRMTAVWAPIA